MVHLNPLWINTMLDKESRGELLPGGGAYGVAAGRSREPFEFFVPYFELLAESGRDIRGDFHNFVFIHASEARLRSILYADWNRNTRLRMYHYCDREGRPITVKADDVARMQSIFRAHNLDFFFGTPVKSLQSAKGRQVRVRLPYWEDKQGEIRRISTKGGQGVASLKVAFLIDGLEKEITFTDLSIDDIEFLDSDTRQLLGGKVIENFEREVAILLGHKFEKKKHAASQAEHEREDELKLRRLLSFSDIEIDGEDDRRRFTALMLMASVMLGDAEATARYQPQIEAWLSGASPKHPLPVFIAAYLQLALFVATRNPTLRTAVKACRAAHPDLPPILTRLLNKVRDIKTTRHSNK